MIITEVEPGGWAGWRWVTLEDGTRHSVTLTEIEARLSAGEWVLCDPHS